MVKIIKRDVILELIKYNPQGLTIQELADKSGFSRITIVAILAKLEGQNLIEVRNIGAAKLHTLKEENNGTNTP